MGDKHKLLAGCILGVSLIFSISLISGTIFASEADVTFPVAELGNCTNKKECMTFCDKEENRVACISFAEQKALLPPEEIQRVKKFLEVGSGPGNCKNQKSCEAYCNNTQNISTCVDFAEKAGFMKKDDVERARKFIPLMEKGETPGGCKNKEQCETYCHQEDHVVECSDFGLKVGAISQEDHERIKKTGGKGPGGCRGQEKCQSFCNDSANQEICLNFAQEHGFIEKEKIEGIRESTQYTRGSEHSFPSEIKTCLESAVGLERAQEIERGEITPGSELGRTISTCFRSIERPQKEMQQRLNQIPAENQDQKSNYDSENMPRDFMEQRHIPEFQQQERPAEFRQDMMIPQDRPTGDMPHMYQQPKPEYIPPQSSLLITSPYLGALIRFLLGN